MKAISLFAGVGAFELAMQENGIETVLSCEIDKYACQVLKKHFPKSEVFNDDVRKLKGSDIISKHGRIDIITAGFPCQTFSIAGKREGFRNATKGTLYFEVARLVDEIHPKYVFLENVRGLVSHDNGRTIGTIFESLHELGYDAEWQILNSRYFNVPQNRERIYIVGHLRNGSTRQIFPIRKSNKRVNNPQAKSKGIRPRFRGSIPQKRRYDECIESMRDGNRQLSTGIKIPSATKCGYEIAENGDSIRISHIGSDTGRGRVGKKCSQSLVTGGDMHTMTNNRIRRLTPIECERLQSFPDNWTNVNGMSDTQRYKQMGNSITVNVLREMFKKIA